jgi:hypothetical protein
MFVGGVLVPKLPLKRLTNPNTAGKKAKKAIASTACVTRKLLLNFHVDDFIKKSPPFSND